MNQRRIKNNNSNKELKKKEERLILPYHRCANRSGQVRSKQKKSTQNASSSHPFPSYCSILHNFDVSFIP